MLNMRTLVFVVLVVDSGFVCAMEEQNAYPAEEYMQRFQEEHYSSNQTCVIKVVEKKCIPHKVFQTGEYAWNGSINSQSTHKEPLFEDFDMQTGLSSQEYDAQVENICATDTYTKKVQKECHNSKPCVVKVAKEGCIPQMVHGLCDLVCGKCCKKQNNDM